MYTDVKVYLYVNTLMCLCVNMRTHEYAHTLTHKHIYVHMCSMYLRRDTFSTSSEDESIGVRKASSDERTSCFWYLGKMPGRSRA